MKAKIKETDLSFNGLTLRKSTKYIVIHHTGNPYDDDLSAAEIHHSHIVQQGWSGIGYHYVIRKDGTIERGRPRQMIGSHAYGFNSESIGIHVCGNFEVAEPTAEQLTSLSILIAELCTIYGLVASRDVVVGHRDLMATACPGENLYRDMQSIRGNAEWYRLNP